MTRAALGTLFALALMEMALAPRVSAASAMNSSGVQFFGCSVSNDPSPPDFSVPAGAVPLGLAMADFTGDSHPDLATLELDRLDAFHAYYVIQIQLTEGGRQSLALTAPPRGLVVTPMDVTGDGTLDLVVQSVGSKVPVAVFLNDGCGHFSANNSARFAKKIREIPSGPDFRASKLRFESAALARGPSAAGSQEKPRCFLHDYNGSHFFAYDGAPVLLFVAPRTSRAPPAAT